MWNKAYLESKVLSADPLELVQILYQEAIAAVQDARGHLAAGDIGGRSAAVSKAMSVLSELTTSLDMQAGGEISRNLARLYAYMNKQLSEANYRQVDPPLAETLTLLHTLAEAFRGIRNKPAPRPDETLFDTDTGLSSAAPLAARFLQESSTAGTRGWSA
jgi:flagellar protein FliS